jgi:pimeloyl-ACP methyl ester carboxylesterase
MLFPRSAVGRNVTDSSDDGDDADDGPPPQEPETGESVTLAVGDSEYRGRLNTPEDGIEGGRGILVVPGAGHGPFGTVFATFADAAEARGFTVARFETWADHEALEAKTPEQHRREIEAGIESLRSRGCESVTLVAKSFGGGLALRRGPFAVERMVLWAPAVRFEEGEDFPAISSAELAEIDVPVRILQGEDDQVVSVANARQLAEHLPEGELIALAGEDHSFMHDEVRVIERTLDFL